MRCMYGDVGVAVSCSLQTTNQSNLMIARGFVDTTAKAVGNVVETLGDIVADLLETAGSAVWPRHPHGLVHIQQDRSYRIGNRGCEIAAREDEFSDFQSLLKDARVRISVVQPKEITPKAFANLSPRLEGTDNLGIRSPK
jgi:hypothetical protein